MALLDSSHGLGPLAPVRQQYGLHIRGGDLRDELRAELRLHVVPKRRPLLVFGLASVPTPRPLKASTDIQNLCSPRTSVLEFEGRTYESKGWILR